MTHGNLATPPLSLLGRARFRRAVRKPFLLVLHPSACGRLFPSQASQRARDTRNKPAHTRVPTSGEQSPRGSGIGLATYCYSMWDHDEHSPTRRLATVRITGSGHPSTQTQTQHTQRIACSLDYSSEYLVSESKSYTSAPEVRVLVVEPFGRRSEAICQRCRAHSSSGPVAHSSSGLVHRTQWNNI